MGHYKKYLHVERLESEECAGLLDNGEVFVTAKVDGSNGCAYWSDKTGRVTAGSRNNELSDENDNAFFSAWLQGDSEEARLLRAYCSAHRNRVVYGEWMGRNTFVGAFKHYDKTALGTLILFDVYDIEAEEFLPERQWRNELAQAGLEPYFVKLLAVLDHPAIDDIEAVAQTNQFLLEGTELVGEGVVCKVPGWKNAFGRTAYGKLVLDEFKKQRKSAAAKEGVEESIVENYMTDAELDKTIAKVCARCSSETFDPDSRKMVGMLTSICWNDLLTECPNWAKKMKNPVVDFGKLAGLCSARAKAHASLREARGA